MTREADAGRRQEKGAGDASRLEPSPTGCGYVSRETRPPDEIFNPESDRPPTGKVVVTGVERAD